MFPRWHELPPRYDTNDREVDPDVDERDGDCTHQDRSRNDTSRVLHLVADVADVVIAEVVVDADPSRRAQPEKESEREIERARREIKRNARIEVERTSQNHRQHGDQRSRPERDRNLCDRLNAAVQKRDVDDSDHGDEHDHPRSGQSRPQILGVLGEADVAGRDLEWSAQDELPDEQESHQPAESRRSERVAQVAE